jgi:outer membrane protein OmpU
MKKTLIALAVAGVAVAAGANASEVYNQDGKSLSLGGRAEARMKVASGDVEDASRIRFDVKGKVAISDDLYGIGFWEAQYQSNDNTGGDDLDNRKIYAGLGGNFGEITYGKNSAALGVITDFTDILLSDYTALASSKVATSDRIDNLLGYKGQFDNFSLEAAYRFADRIKDSTTNTSNTDYDNNDFSGFNASGIYDFSGTGFKLGLGYAHEESIDKNNDGSAVSSGTYTGNIDQYMVALSYETGPFYVAGLYTNKDYDEGVDSYDGYELAASYMFTKTKLSATYAYGETDDEVTDALGLEVAYYFQPNFRGYIAYEFNFLDDGDSVRQEGTTTRTPLNDVQADDEATIGLRYDF